MPTASAASSAFRRRLKPLPWTTFTSGWRVGRLYVAESEARVIGVVRIEEMAPERGKISRLGVPDDWKGVGRALLDHVERLARAEDFDTG